MLQADPKRKRKFPIWTIIDILIVIFFTYLAVLGYKFRAERLNAEKNTPEYPAISVNVTHLLESVNK